MGDAGAGKWDIAPLPGQQASNWGGSWLGVPSEGKNVEAAKALAEWLTAPEQQVKLFTEAAHFPSSPQAAEDPAVVDATNEYFSDAPTGQIFGRRRRTSSGRRSARTTPRSRTRSPRR